jgi:hypothetical protein
MRFALLLAVLLVPGATESYAQAARPQRPIQGLFGSGYGAADQSLVFGGSLGAGWDDNIFAGSGQRQGGVQDPRRARSGRYGLGSAGLSYGWARDRVQFGASASTTARYYPGTLASIVSSHGGSARFSMRVRQGTRLSAGQSIAYQPRNLLDLFAGLDDDDLGLLPIADEDTAIGLTRHRTLGTSARLSHSHQIDRRSSIYASYGYLHRQVSWSDRRYGRHSVGGGYSRDLTPGLSLRIGYRYNNTRHYGESTVEPLQTHNIDGGVNYNRALSFSRRTTLSFSTGSRAVTNAGRTRFRATGSARLAHQIGRTWSTWVAYTRNVGFIDAFDQPFDYDAATGGIGGMLTRRVQFSASARASYGRLGFAGGRRYDTFSGTAGVGLPLTRFLSAGASYVFHTYAFGEDVVLPPDMSRSLHRHGVRGTVSLSAPLYTRARRP